MRLKIKTIKNKGVWEEFLSGVEGEKTFLQSWNWGVFEERMGNKIWRLGVYKHEARSTNYELREKQTHPALISVALVVRISAKRGRFLYVPHGPIIVSSIKYKVSRILEALKTELKKIAQQEKCAFIRIAPVWDRRGKNEQIFRDLGFRRAPMHINPELTWNLDLALSEDELLMNMRKTTRYLIKKGLKDKDLTIRKSKDIKDVEVFYRLYQETAQRHNFTPFSLEYLKNEFQAFAQDDQILILQALYKREVIASSIVVFWGGIGFYHQGASVHKYQNLNTSYLLQWESIREAKKRGCNTYNFWGIADVDTEDDLKKHPWKGLTIFKKGFGGQKRAYVKTQDLPLNWRYWLCYVFELLRRRKRGF